MTIHNVFSRHPLSNACEAPEPCQQASVLLLLLPGCTTLLGEDQETEDIDCEMEPTSEGCFEPVVTEDDCMPNQVFTGESCRVMLRPEKLDFGTSEATLQIGTEMQQLTPSFLGDAPRKWA